MSIATAIASRNQKEQQNNGIGKPSKGVNIKAHKLWVKFKQYKPNLKYRYPTLELKYICTLHVVKINRLIAKRNYDDRIEYSFFPLYN